MRWLLVFVLLAVAAAARAHDVPNDVKVRAFVKPEGRTLSLLVRVPMEAMRESDIPIRGPGYIDLPRVGKSLETAARLWLTDNIDVYEDGRKLPAPRVAATRIALASDRSFASYDSALAAVRSPPLDAALDLYWKQQYLDALLEYPIASDRGEFAIDARLARLGAQVTTTLRFLPPGSSERAFEIHGEAGMLALDPRWHHAAWRFVQMGFFHILDGTDHLLFIACLVIPFRRLRPLVIIATAFTVAHSITLVAAASGWAPEGLWFPPLVEVLIAASILYMALENIVGSNAQRRWIVAFAFGLVHGFGFAFALRESLQFAGAHLATALFAFNVGVELGQIAVLLVLVPLLSFVFRYIPERVGTIILSAFVAHTAWHWLTERYVDLKKFPFPAFDAAAAASLMRWAMAAIALGVLVWLVNGRMKLWLGLDSRLRGNDTSGDEGSRIAEDPHPR